MYVRASARAPIGRGKCRPTGGLVSGCASPDTLRGIEPLRAHSSRGDRICGRRTLAFSPVIAIALAIAGCGGGEQTAGNGEPTATATPTGTPAGAGRSTGRIVGRATDKRAGRPLADIIIVVGYKGVQRAAVTGPDGRYVVPDVPANEPAAVLGFHEGNYRYHNSRYDANVVPRLTPGQTFEYDFAVSQLNDPAGQPQVSDPALMPDAVRPGETVEFGLTVRGGRGGLSDEVFAASPELGRIAWLKPVGDDRYRATLAIPRDILPGEYPFAYFAASNECYDPALFPTRVLRVMA